MDFFDLNKRYIVKIRFPFSVDSFSHISRLTAALRYIDTHGAVDPYRQVRLSRIRARAKIIMFHVGSPPEMTLVVNPGWLALLVAILGQYKNIKNNIPEIMDDVRHVVSTIKGMTYNEKENLILWIRGHIYDSYGEFEAVIRNTADNLDRFEDELHKAADTLARKRYELMGRERDLPEIEVIDLDED